MAKDEAKIIRRGDIYCAPGCGRGCTYKEYWTATLAAGELAKRMGKGWKPQVWDNLGWHYGAVKGVAHIYPTIDKGKIIEYTLFFNSDQQIVVSHKNPVMAIKLAISQAKDRLRMVEADIRVLERLS